MPTEFVVPGANRASAALDLARTVVRRAERLLVSSPIEGSLVGRYLNRLSDLLWAHGPLGRGRGAPAGPGRTPSGRAGTATADPAERRRPD